MNQDIKLVIDELNQIEDADYIVIYSAVTLLETLGNKVAEQASEIESLRISYDAACMLVAQLHEAVMGEVVGPHHGVVEDVCNKMAAQAAVIEKLRSVLDKVLCTHYYHTDDGAVSTYEAIKVLDIPTDSKQILADWMREQMGEPINMVIHYDEAGLEHRIHLTQPLFKLP